jgi:hypothetical protein
MTDKLETIDDVLAALVQLAKGAKSLAAAMRTVLDATAITDRETHAFAHRLYMVLNDMGVQLANAEAMLPDKFRDAR